MRLRFSHRCAPARCGRRSGRPHGAGAYGT